MNVLVISDHFDAPGDEEYVIRLVDDPEMAAKQARVVWESDLEDAKKEKAMKQDAAALNDVGTYWDSDNGMIKWEDGSYVAYNVTTVHNFPFPASAVDNK